MDENSSERPIRLITKVELSEDLAPQLIVYQVPFTDTRPLERFMVSLQQFLLRN